MSGGNRGGGGALRPLGAHMSISGGFLTAVRQSEAAGATALQIFTKSQLRWDAPPITEAAACEFREAAAKAGIGFISVHDSYLINLASGSEDLRCKSIASLTLEVRRAEQLGCACVVLHPGSPKEDGAEAGIARVAAGLREALAATDGSAVGLALENTAGQGATLGVSFAELAKIIRAAGGGKRLGVCLDTCHAFASGYELRTPMAVRLMADEFDREIGLDRLWMLHLNDSRKDVGSRVDRHEHIGKGCIGEEGFRCVLSDPAFRGLPGILETPKDEADGTMAADRENMALLRRLEG